MLKNKFNYMMFKIKHLYFKIKIKIMNILKKLRKPQFGIFLSFLVLFVSCNNSSGVNDVKADIVLKMGETYTSYNEGDDYFTVINDFGEESLFLFENLDRIANITQNQEKNSEYNLQIEFDNTESLVSLNNISQLSNNSVSMDVVFNNNNTFYESSVVLDTDITVEQFVSSLIGEYDLGNIDAIVSSRCPWCIVVVVVAAIAACENAQSACTPCNGNLQVTACGCSCTVPTP